VGGLHERVVRSGQQAAPDAGVLLHLLPLGGLERAPLEQDAVRDPDLADVVRDARMHEPLRLTLVEPDVPGQTAAEHGDPMGMLARLGIT
jgi:hypothetical protein